MHQHSNRTNGFTVVRGKPYLLGEYYQDPVNPIDGTTIGTQLVIENTNPYTNIVDITLDNRDNPPGTYQELLDRISAERHSLRTYLDVIKPGILAEIDYQVESERTGLLVRKVIARLWTNNKSTYYDENTNGGTVITNYVDELSKVLADRAVGSDRLVIRLDKLSLYRVAIQRPDILPYDTYQRGNRTVPYHHGGTSQIDVPSNRYYHYDHEKHIFGLSEYDITRNDPNQSTLIPIGYFSLNRTFVTTTAMQVLFRLSVWENDTVTVRDCSEIIRVLGGVPNSDRPSHGSRPSYHDDHCPHEDHHHHDRHDRVTDLTVEEADEILSEIV